MDHSKVVIVTGGGKGIGAEVAMHFLSLNYRVVIADIKPPHNSYFTTDTKRLLVIKTDVKSEASIKSMIERTISHFGRIDCLVNNAGLLPDSIKSLEQTSAKLWNEFIATNLTGPFLCSKHAVPHLRKSKGNIINIASTRALQSEGNKEPYAASKGGLVALTHELAITLGPDVRVNCISPGWIDTQNEKLKKSDHTQHPVGRVGKPEDIANMAAFLSSDSAEFITGQNFVVDGGMTVKMIYK